jgi:hypothetical protein
VALDPKLGYYAFEYATAFIISGIELSPLTMPLAQAHAHNPAGEWTSQHLMSVNAKFAGITREDLLGVANRFGIGTAPKILKLVGEAVAAWPEFAAQAGVNELEVMRIIEHHSVQLQRIF